MYKKKNNMQWFALFVLVCGFTLLVLNATNIYPHRNYERLNGTVTESGIISGHAIQLAEDGGLSVDPTGALQLKPISRRSILANASPDQTQTPQPFEIPDHSVVVSDTDGLVTRTASLPNEVLLFNGTNIVWGDPVNVSSATLPTGHILIGSQEGVGVPRLIRGDVEITSLGVSSLTNGAVTSSKIADASITADKISPGSDRQVLTSIGGRVAWRDPESTRYVRTGKGASSLTETTVLDPHSYDFINSFETEATAVELEAFGQCTASSSSVNIGIVVSDGQNVVPYMITIAVSTTFFWKMSGYIVRASGSTGSIFLSFVGEEVGTSRFLVLDIDWISSVSIAVAAQAALGEVSPEAVTCLWSSATLVRPQT